MTDFEAWYFDQYPLEREMIQAGSMSSGRRREEYLECWNKAQAPLKQAIQAITTQVDGNIRPTVRDCVNGQNNVEDIYGYCDQIESIAAAAMKEPQP